MCPQTAVLWSPEKNTIPRFGRNPGEKGWKGGSEALKPLETRLAGVQAARESLVHTPWIVSHINKDNDHRAISIIRLHCIKWLTPLSTYISHRLVQTSLVAQMVKHPPAMQETQVQSLVGKIPWRRKWQPTPVFLPGKSHGWSLVGYSPWGSKESDTIEPLHFTSKHVLTPFSWWHLRTLFLGIVFLLLLILRLEVNCINYNFFKYI